MQKSLLGTALILIGFASSAYAQNPLETDQQKFSYAVGIQIGQNINAQPMEVDKAALLLGIADTINGQEMKLTVQEMQAAISAYQAQEQQRQAALGQQNQARGAQFLAENRKNNGVVELQSGLQYKVLIEGTGVQPTATDTVVVHYRGTLIDGTEFDSSYGRGQPLTIPLDGVIPGWQEAVPLMKVGSKWTIYVPAELGYGPNSTGPIGPNSTLIFDIELLAVNK